MREQWRDKDSMQALVQVQGVTPRPREISAFGLSLPLRWIHFHTKAGTVLNALADFDAPGGVYLYI